jgi:hypothetical protein
MSDEMDSVMRDRENAEAAAQQEADQRGPADEVSEEHKINLFEGAARDTLAHLRKGEHESTIAAFAIVIVMSDGTWQQAVCGDTLPLLGGLEMVKDRALAAARFSQLAVGREIAQ